jgi:hypothetical protein
MGLKMASYVKKQYRNTDIYHVHGEDEDFYFAGDEAFRINDKLEYFSWKTLEIDGEIEGVDFFQRKGIDKKGYKAKETY